MARSILKIVFLITLLLVGISTALTETTPKTTKLTIAILTELSGPFAANGADAKIGYDTAFDFWTTNGRIGNYEVSLRYLDSEGDGATAVTRFADATTTANLAAVVLNRSQVAMPVNPISKRNKIPILGAAGHPDFVRQNPYAFRFWPSATAEGQALTRRARAFGAKRAAVISTEDEYMLSLASSFVSSFRNAQGNICYEQSIASNSNDFSAVVAKIKASKPDTVFVNVGIPQIGPLIRKLREQKITVPILGNLWIQKDEVIASAGAAAVEGALFIGMNIEFPKFTQALRAHEDPVSPNNIKYATFTALSFALHALQISDKISDPTTMFAVLSQITSIPLPDGPLQIVDREAKYQLRYYTIHDGKAVPE